MKPLTLRETVEKGECSVVGCKSKARGKFCPHHKCQHYRLKDPILYSYNNKKNRAKERGIYFDLTIEEFREFCYETEYISKSGKTAGSYDVDRIIEGVTPGYTRSNIQILEKIANIKKYKKYNAESKKAETIIETIIPPETLPF